MKYNKFLEDLDLIESDHKKFSIETPLREDAFELSDQEKIDLIKKNVGEILHTLGMDMTCLLYTSPSPRDGLLSRMPSSA